MFTSRFTAFVFLLISFGLFVWAAPTNTGKAVAEIAARDDATSPIIAALLDLHVKVLAVVKLLGALSLYIISLQSLLTDSWY